MCCALAISGAGERSNSQGWRVGHGSENQWKSGCFQVRFMQNTYIIVVITYLLQTNKIGDFNGSFLSTFLIRLLLKLVLLIKSFD